MRPPSDDATNPPRIVTGGGLVEDAACTATIIAAEQTGRRCYAMDIDPRYVAVAIARWEQFTGRKAERANG